MEDVGMMDRLLTTFTRITTQSDIVLSSKFFLVSITIVIGLVIILISIYLRRRKMMSNSKKNPVDLFSGRLKDRERIFHFARVALRKLRSRIDVLPSKQWKDQRKRDVLKNIIQIGAKIEDKLFKKNIPNRREKQVIPNSLVTFDLEPQTRRDQTMLPKEIVYVLKSMKVFGHFDKPLFAQLFRHLETVNLLEDSCLFEPNQEDDAIFVVQTGIVNLYMIEEKNRMSLIKKVHAGESIFSLMTILETLARGKTVHYRKLKATAQTNVTILKLPLIEFAKIFKEYPASMVRIVQMIMIRIQRVTFMALNTYLGLNRELIRQRTNRVTNIRSPLRSPSIGDDRKVKVSKKKLRKLSNQKTDDSQLPPLAKQFPMRQRSLGAIESKKIMKKISRDENKPRRQSIEWNRDKDFEAFVSRARIEKTNIQRPKSYDDIPSNEDVAEMHRIEATIATKLQLKNSSTLNGRLVLRRLKCGEKLIEEGNTDCDLHFLISGQVAIHQHDKSGEEILLYYLKIGESIGSMNLLTGEGSLFSVMAKSDSIMVILKRSAFYGILCEEPDIVLPICYETIRRFSSFTRQIDYALDWQLVESGKALYKQNDPSENIYIIINGRLRSVVKNELDDKNIAAEYGRGDLVGFVEVLIGVERSSSLMAIRDTELACLPSGIVNVIRTRYPRIITRLLNLLGKRLLGATVAASATLHSGNSTTANISNGPNDFSESLAHMNLFTSDSNNLPKDNSTIRSAIDKKQSYELKNNEFDLNLHSNLSTLAILPVNTLVPLKAFTAELSLAFSQIGLTMRLTRTNIIERFGSQIFDTANDYRLSAWLSQQEDLHRMVIYECEHKVSPWTLRCLRQADCVLIVANSGQSHLPTQFETEIEYGSFRAQKELVLLYRKEKDEEVEIRTRDVLQKGVDNAIHNIRKALLGEMLSPERDPKRRYRTKPLGTVDWLNARSWCSFHHHIRCSDRVLQSYKSESEIEETYSKIANMEYDRLSDFSRLARLLTGTGIGVALGGGGARGNAHYSLITTLIDFNVPIDMIGGTSMGGYVSALWAMHAPNSKIVLNKARQFARSMNSITNKIFDLTYPITSMFTGAGFNEQIEVTFGDTQIEDLWLPYFCVSTDITSSCMRIHTSGSVWRYVRASMSLASYLPPLCDPIDGHLLLDGGYVNNLPADVIHNMGASVVFANDVSSRLNDNLTSYGDSLSGWWLLWKRWNPFTSLINVPDMEEIQSRLAYVSSQRQMNLIKRLPFVYYLRAPVDGFSTLQFGSFDEILEVGEKHFRSLFAEWKEYGSFDKDIFQKQNPENFFFHRHTTVPDLPANQVEKIKSKSTYQPPNFIDLTILINRIEDDVDNYETDSTNDDETLSVLDNEETVNLPENNQNNSQKSTVHFNTSSNLNQNNKMMNRRNKTKKISFIDNYLDFVPTDDSPIDEVEEEEDDDDDEKNIISDNGNEGDDEEVLEENKKKKKLAELKKLIMRKRYKTDGNLTDGEYEGNERLLHQVDGAAPHVYDFIEHLLRHVTMSDSELTVPTRSVAQDESEMSSKLQRHKRKKKNFKRSQTDQSCHLDQLAIDNSN
ncbi:hypothetical protein SNEBB_008814 [Seison nebaliae]|nr:hypothetical protein SNEBB_008814 [Seison nebaliae]